jgi:hypothetical protein
MASDAGATASILQALRGDRHAARPGNAASQLRPRAATTSAANGKIPASALAGRQPFLLVSKRHFRAIFSAPLSIVRHRQSPSLRRSFALQQSNSV